jgi:alpha-galactosidase
VHERAAAVLRERSIGTVLTDEKTGGSMPTPDRTAVQLRGGGVSVILDTRSPVPVVLHWGRDLGDLSDEHVDQLRKTAVAAIAHNAPDSPRIQSIWPSQRDGWVGVPALSGHAAGAASHSSPTLAGVDAQEAFVTFQLVDAQAALRIELRYELHQSGILAVTPSLHRDAAMGDVTEPYAVGALTASMPVPAAAQEVMDFTGGWLRERRPQRRPIAFGSFTRESRRGRTGHDAAFLLLTGTPGFGFRSGELWGAHLAWSGDQRHVVDHLPEGSGGFATSIGAGELLHPGEVLLADGDVYTAPTVLFAWSDDGLDGIAARFHAFQRSSPRHPATPRPLILNTWESVYFDQDLPRLLAIADLAADAGVERFVLDDGWFSGRRDATSSLGDWTVDADRWPDGLHPLVERVRYRGMEFGLWVEPEMVSPTSELAAEHPDWVLAPELDPGLTARSQHVLNLGHPDAAAYVLDRLDALVAEYGIRYLKWDHNRDLLQAVTRAHPGGHAGVHDTTRATYALMDELRRRHPGLEIESCAGGGGRVDLGMAEHVERFWASDCNDPVERLDIERWTALLIAPELIGTHVGTARSHTTGRVSDLSFRLVSTLFGHAGVEWDLSTATMDELTVVARWAALYKSTRQLVAEGTVVNADLPDDATILRGVVGDGGAAALFLWARLRSSVSDQSGRVRMPGLDPDAGYSVRLLEPFGPARRSTAADPGWVADAGPDGTEFAGSLLMHAGLPLPDLAPESALLVELRRLR